jgi:hypothetical protein
VVALNNISSDIAVVQLKRVSYIDGSYEFDQSLKAEMHNAIDPNKLIPIADTYVMEL